MRWTCSRVSASMTTVRSSPTGSRPHSSSCQLWRWCGWTPSFTPRCLSPHTSPVYRYRHMVITAASPVTADGGCGDVGGSPSSRAALSSCSSSCWLMARLVLSMVLSMVLAPPRRLTSSVTLGQAGQRCVTMNGEDSHWLTPLHFYYATICIVS